MTLPPSDCLEIIRARTIVPVTREPLENGAIVLRGGRIVAAGEFEDIAGNYAAARVTDLGELLLMPGLVNAHCHLDYTMMLGQISRPSSFPDWIKGILALKAHWSYSEYATSWVEGARQLLASGTTTVADIEAVPELLPEVWNATPLRVISLLEMTGVRAANEPRRILAEALGRIARLPITDQKRAGLSPHALYSTPPELLAIVAETLQRRALPTAIHVAESKEEWDMFHDGAGPLFDWLKSQRDMTDCGGRSPVGQLGSLGMLRPETLLIHANYLAADDPELIAKGGASVAHCPRSHAYFKHAPFEYERLRDAGVNLCLGTDSLASVVKNRGNQPTELNLWEELHLFAKGRPAVAPAELLRLVTANGARALGLPCGALESGNWADVIAVDARSVEDLLAGPVTVRRRMVAGAWVG